MADAIKQGVNPVNEITFGICITGRPADITTAEYTVVKDAEGLTIAINGQIQEWNAMDQKGYTKRLKTANSISITMGGKRNYGDPGNDYVASRAFKIGQDCNSVLKITFPNGDTLYMPCVINTTSMAGDAVAIDALQWEALSDGKPTYVDYQSA